MGALPVRGAVLGAVTASAGVVVAGVGPDLVVLSAATGAVLYTFHDPAPAPPPLTGSTRFWAGPTISRGVVYLGSIDGNLYAFAV